MRVRLRSRRVARKAFLKVSDKNGQPEFGLAFLLFVPGFWRSELARRSSAT
jgi:hypothetical protein